MNEPALQASAYRINRKHLPILATVGFITIAYVMHAVFAQTIWAWTMLLAAIGIMVITKLWPGSQIWLVTVGIGIMLATPVSTNITLKHCLSMTTGMVLAVIAPYWLAKHNFKHSLVHFNLRLRRPWTHEEIFYVAFAVIACSLSMFAYFNGSDAHRNWPLSTTSDIIIVFMSIMVIGIWEEFFFIATIYGIFQRLLPYAWAVILQAILFTAFLYQIGFKDWIVPLVFMYTIFQAYVFHKTKTLFITLTIHVLVDLSVFINLLLSAKN